MTLPDSVFIHPAALCESDQIGPRTRVWAFAHVMPGAVVGADCNVCDHAFIESGAVVGNGVTVKNNVLVWDRVCIEDDVFLGPNAVFTNDLRPRASIKKGHDGLAPTIVRRGATIGANATVVCGTTIGEGAFVAAGAVVAADVAPYSLVAGNPARHKAWVCWCGEVLADDLACGCGRSYALAADAGLAPIGPDSDNSTG